MLKKAKLYKQEEINTISVFLKCLSFKSVLLESLVLNFLIVSMHGSLDAHFEQPRFFAL